MTGAFIRYSGSAFLVALAWLAVPAQADFQVLSGWGWVQATAGSSTNADSRTGYDGRLSVSARGQQESQSWTVATALNWGPAGNPAAGWSIYGGMVPEFDAPASSYQQSEVQGSWTLRIGAADEPFEVSNAFLFSPAPALSIYDLTTSQWAYVIGGDLRFADGLLLAGHDYRLDLAGRTALESSGLEFTTRSAPTAESVPEPASALLGLLGFSLAARLRQRTR